MRSLQLILATLLVAAFALLPACSGDDDDNGPVTAGDTGPADALAGYWDAGADAGAALVEMNDLWATFAAQAADPDVPAETVLEAAEDFAAGCDEAAGRLRVWHDLEQDIRAQGAKSQFSDEVLATALEVLDAAAVAAETGAEGLVVGWKALSGLDSLRRALADPDGTLPVNGYLASALASRLVHRDEVVDAAILADDDHGGLLPLDDLEGSTAAERATYYADLEDEHAVKRQCRGAVPAWDTAERATSLELLEYAARGHVRLFAGVGAGGSPLADLSDHLTGAGESAPTMHDVTFSLRNGDGSDPITGQAMLILRRRGQPDQSPRLAVLAGASAQVVAELPAGSYDVVALADGWARDVLADAVTSDGQTLQLRLRHLEQDALILEAVEAPAMGGAGMAIDLRAVAASTRGAGLSFDWTIRGGATESVRPDGERCRFTPTAAGTYVAAVTVRDDHGAAATDSATIEVTSFALEVFRTDFLAEQIVDFHFNPGERDTLWLWVANRGDETVVGTPRVTGRYGLQLDHEDATWTLPAGQQTRWQVPVTLPVDWDQPRAAFDFAFTSGNETLVQQLDYAVQFYVHVDYVNSPVTSRVLLVSGTVANPALETAELVIDRDRSLTYTLPLENGAFEQVVILPGSQETRRIRIEVAAESGTWRETRTAGFMASIPNADFRTTLFWDTNGTDVDLWITDPDGEKCYYANQSTASGLELDVDDVTGYGPENITGESNLPAGEYLVQVHYFSDHGTGLASNCTVLVTLHEGTSAETVDVYEETITDGDVWTVAIVEWDGTQAVAVRPAHRPVTEQPRMSEK